MRKPVPDAGLQAIDDLERTIVLGRLELWEFNGVTAEEIATHLPAVERDARVACDRLRAEHRERQQGAQR